MLLDSITEVGAGTAKELAIMIGVENNSRSIESKPHKIIINAELIS